MTELVTTSMPKGRGRKACAPPRKRAKKIPIEVHKTFSEVLQEQRFSLFDEDTQSGGSDPELQMSGGSSAVIAESFFASGGDVQSSNTTIGKHHHRVGVLN